MMSRASQSDVTEFWKLSLTNSNNIVLATFGVRYNSRFVSKRFIQNFHKLLTTPRIYQGCLKRGSRSAIFFYELWRL